MKPRNRPTKKYAIQLLLLRVPCYQSIKNLLLTFLAAFALSGCATATRLSIRPEEANYHFAIRHSQPKPQAFNNVELALAEAFNDLPKVLKLKQPETGTFLLKPLVAYQVGGSIGPIQHGRYTLRIVVGSSSATLDFELAPEESEGTWAPESEIPKIKAAFQGIAAKVAQAVNGSLQ